MFEHEQKFSANPEADQLWKEFNRRLDKTDEENLLNMWDDGLVSTVAMRESIQCLNYKALGDIMGKVQVLQGQLQLLQLESEIPRPELQGLHAQLQILVGEMFPYLAVRIKQAPVSLLKRPILRPSSGRTPAESETKSAEGETDAGEGEAHAAQPPEDEGSRDAGDAVS
jgi:hypothetical protein